MLFVIHKFIFGNRYESITLIYNTMVLVYYILFLLFVRFSFILFKNHFYLGRIDGQIPELNVNRYESIT